MGLHIAFGCVRLNPFFVWLTSYCKSMSSKIIINTLSSIHMLVCLISQASFYTRTPPFDFPIVLFNGVSFAERNVVQERKFDIGKCVFNFRLLFFFSILYDDVHVLLFDKLHLNQTSFYSQSVLRACVPVLGHSFHWWWSCRRQWNGTACWKLDEQANIERIATKIWRIWKLIIYHVRILRITQFVPTVREKIRSLCTKSDAPWPDSTHFDPQLQRQQPNYVRINTFL